MSEIFSSHKEALSQEQFLSRIKAVLSAFTGGQENFFNQERVSKEAVKCLSEIRPDILFVITNAVDDFSKNARLFSTFDCPIPPREKDKSAIVSALNDYGSEFIGLAPTYPILYLGQLLDIDL